MNRYFYEKGKITNRHMKKMLSFMYHQENSNLGDSEISHTMRMTQIKNSRSSLCWQRCG